MADFFTVSLHSPNSRQMPASRAAQGNSQWPQESSENSYWSCDPTIHCDSGNPNRYLYQPITKVWCQSIWGHVSYPTDSLTAIRPGLCNSLYSLTAIRPGLCNSLYSLTAIRPGLCNSLYSLTAIRPGLCNSLYSLTAIRPGLCNSLYSLTAIRPGLCNSLSKMRSRRQVAARALGTDEQVEITDTLGC